MSLPGTVTATACRRRRPAQIRGRRCACLDEHGSAAAETLSRLEHLLPMQITGFDAYAADAAHPMKVETGEHDARPTIIGTTAGTDQSFHAFYV